MAEMRRLLILLSVGLITLVAPGAPATLAARPPPSTLAAQTLRDGIAPGVNATTSGFGTATAIVPAGYYVTYLVQSDPTLAGRAIEIWTRGAGSDWSRVTIRTADARGNVNYHARVSDWT